jgi:uncharacterized circularly permuted ATP-grasp superfamily protein
MAPIRTPLLSGRAPSPRPFNPRSGTVRDTRSGLDEFDSRAANLGALTLSPLTAPLSLRITRPGATEVVPAHNAILDDTGCLRDYAAPTARHLLTRTPEQQRGFDAELTAGLAELQRSQKPTSINGMVVPLKGALLDKLVASTGPILRASRALLQKLLSQPDCTPGDLGLEGVPPEIAERIHQILTGSIYFERKIIHPALADYPFLSVSGFDAAFGDPEKGEPVFFEGNFGTPGGLGVNGELVQQVAQRDPELHATYSDRLRPDHTLEHLRQAIESSARAWTGRDGVCAVLSPGRIYQAVQSSCERTAAAMGWPVVCPEDLYQGADGFIRFKQGEIREDDPILTGLYSRAEESFVLQSPSDGLGFRSSFFSSNPEAGERLGVKLEPGVGYQFVYDAGGKITDVVRDEEGKPALQKPRVELPLIPGTEQRGSLLQAIQNKQLFLSNLGGRVADDKRLFEMIAQHVAPAHAREGEEIAHPPRTLQGPQLSEFFEASDLRDFVVKAPDRAGGDGVYVLATMEPGAREEIREQVRANPEAFIVQARAEPMVVFTAEEESFGTVTVDGRIFSLMDASGEVRSGPSGVQLRLSAPGGLLSNVSQGGSVAPVVVLD